MRSLITDIKAAVIIVLAVLAIILVTIIPFFFVAFLSYLVCLGFGLTWSWMLAVGVWAVCVLLRWIVSAAKGKDK